MAADSRPPYCGMKGGRSFAAKMWPQNGGRFPRPVDGFFVNFFCIKRRPRRSRSTGNGRASSLQKRTRFEKTLATLVSSECLIGPVALQLERLRQRGQVHEKRRESNSKLGHWTLQVALLLLIAVVFCDDCLARWCGMGGPVEAARHTTGRKRYTLDGQSKFRGVSLVDAAHRAFNCNGGCEENCRHGRGPHFAAAP